MKCFFNNIYLIFNGDCVKCLAGVQSEVNSVVENSENEMEQNAAVCHRRENSLRVKAICLLFGGHEFAWFASAMATDFTTNLSSSPESIRTFSVAESEFSLFAFTTR